MTKTKLLLVSLLLVIGLGVTPSSALAQATLTATTSVYTLRPNSNAEAVGPIFFTWQAGAGTIASGQSFNVIYSQPIVGASGVGTAAGPVADFCTTGGVPGPPTVTCAQLTVTAAGDTLTLTNTGAAIAAGFNQGYIELYGVRIATYGLAGGTEITAIAYTSVNSTNPFTFTNGTNVINTLVATVASTTSLTDSGPAAAGTILTCYAVPNPADSGNTFATTVTENWAGAWSSEADELAKAPYLVTNGTLIAITVTGIPLGLTVTPAAPSDISGTQTWGSTPAAYTGVVKNDSNTFVYKIAATARVGVTPESASFGFTLTSSASLQQNNPPMAVSVQLYPPPTSAAPGPFWPAFSYPVFGLAEEAPGSPITAFNFVDCVTNLLYPYVTNYFAPGAVALTSWDTAIEVANTTSSPFASSSAFYTAPQNGSCTFDFYSAGTAASIGTPKEAAPITYTTPVVLSGGTYSFLLSQTPAATLVGGYGIAVCNFLAGYGFAETVDNANGLGNWQVMSGYLAQVYRTSPPSSTIGYAQ